MCGSQESDEKNDDQSNQWNDSLDLIKRVNNDENHKTYEKKEMHSQRCKPRKFLENNFELNLEMTTLPVREDPVERTSDWTHHVFGKSDPKIGLENFVVNYP